MRTTLGNSSCASSLIVRILSFGGTDNIEAQRAARGHVDEQISRNIVAAPTSRVTYEITNLDLARLRIIYLRNAGKSVLVHLRGITMISFWNIFLYLKTQRPWLIDLDGQDGPNGREEKWPASPRAKVLKRFEAVVLEGPCCLGPVGRRC